jgi:prophage DNA circulation protein
MSFDPALPLPYKEDWRQAYRHNNDDTPRLSSYQAPGISPVPFVMESIRLSGGQSVDTAEYPFFGFWSSTPLNEKPHSITVTGFIRGDTYIKNRNDLIESLRVTTSDEIPGYLDLPLWGRFPIVVVEYSVEEKGKENGQSSISLTLTRAGVTLAERWKFKGGGFDEYAKAAQAAKDLKEKAIENFADNLKENADALTLASGFTQFRKNLVDVIGRVQGAQDALNTMTNSAVNITNLIAQGIRSPRDLAQALFSSAASIITGLMDIKNSVDDTVAYFRTRDNLKNCLMQFLSANTYSMELEAVTVKQMATKTEMENLYRTSAIYAASQIIVKLENPTYEQTKGYWGLYENLEASVDKNNPDIYRALEDVRLAVSRELSARNLAAEQIKYIGLPLPLLYLSKYLGCDDEKIRRLNVIADSFVIQGDVVYV